MNHMTPEFKYDICVVGGCGHVGLPLAITFAHRGLEVSVYDTNDRAVETVRAGVMPFLEDGAEPLLKKVIGENLTVANDPTLVSQSRHVVVVIGTPVDEHLNPTFHKMRRFFSTILPHLRDGQCLILRSTVFPGTTEKIRAMVASSGKKLHIAFCPERVAQGKAMEELTELPQIVSGCDEQAVAMAGKLFGRIARSIIEMSPLEAELTKIFANVWRYIQFATANQFFMIATDFGVDFYKIHDALTRDYPRMAGLPKGGFAAGPCLFKDTMQLAAANNNNFSLGHSAMLINEGLPNFLVRHAKLRYDLGAKRVGVLGMAFKGESDDPRESLSYKLRKILEYESAEVLCTDVYIKDPTFLPLEEVVRRSDILFIGTPHREYRTLNVPDAKPVIDIWNLYGKGVFPS
jgi:UDP-N-acetyl-D-mannosaminuronic acid dehydrogenase